MGLKVSTDTEIELSVLPHLKKFILKFHKQSEPVRVDFHSSLGIAMNSVLRKKRAFRKNRERYTDKLKITISQDLAKLSLHHGYLIQFNLEYDHFFSEQLFNWVEAQNYLGVNDSEAVRSFLAFYGITEQELSFDTARTKLNRYKTQYFQRKRISA